jgi:ferrous iron transport protein A
VPPAPGGPLQPEDRAGTEGAGTERTGTVVPLPGLRRGGQARIVAIDANAPAAVSRRLYDLGFRPGTAVDCLHRAPLGNPTVYRIGESDICLRRAEAAHIQVEFPR